VYLIYLNNELADPLADPEYRALLTQMLHASQLSKDGRGKGKGS